MDVSMDVLVAIAASTAKSFIRAAETPVSGNEAPEILLSVGRRLYQDLARAGFGDSPESLKATVVLPPPEEVKEDFPQDVMSGEGAY